MIKGSSTLFRNVYRKFVTQPSVAATSSTDRTTIPAFYHKPSTNTPSAMHLPVNEPGTELVSPHEPLTTTQKLFQEVHSSSPLGRIVTEIPLPQMFPDDVPKFNYVCAGIPFHYPSPEIKISSHEYHNTVANSLPKRLGTVNNVGEQVHNVIKVSGNLLSMGCGEDSAIGTSQFLGLADGVSGWNDSANGHASLWSRLILHRCLDHYLARRTSELVPESTTLLSILDSAHQDALNKISKLDETGSSTLMLARIRPEAMVLDVLSIGDSSIYVVRDGQIIFTNSDVESEQSKQRGIINCPGQIGTNSDQPASRSAQIYSVPIKTGDIVMLCSDGISDNLWQADIVDGLKNEKLDLQSRADKLVHEANDKAFDNFAVCPYQLNSSTSTGGKTDDMTVLVAQIEV